MINNNGFNPVWNEKGSYIFEEGEINTLMFEVYDSDFVGKNLLCWNAVSLDYLRSGYRVVDLINYDF